MTNEDKDDWLRQWAPMIGLVAGLVVGAVIGGYANKQNEKAGFLAGAFFGSFLGLISGEIYNGAMTWLEDAAQPWDTTGKKDDLEKPVKGEKKPDGSPKIVTEKIAEPMN